MTEIKLSFRAQSLDNIGDDTIIGDGELLDPSQEIERQQVVSRIYSVVSDKTQILSDSSITIYCKKSKFVIEAIPDKLDIRKRKAPIVIYGELPKEWSQAWSSSIRFRIKNFSEGINRPLDEKTLDAIEEGLRTAWLKKNQPSNLLLNLLNIDFNESIQLSAEDMMALFMLASFILVIPIAMYIYQLGK